MPVGLQAEIPVVENTVRLSLPSTVLFEAGTGNRKFEEKRVFYADPSFMDVFSFPLVQGDRATALKQEDGKTDATIQALSKISQQLNSAYPFKFDFLDQDMASLYKGQRQMGNIFNLFALLGIFISCLGLYGLSAFMAEQ